MSGLISESGNDRVQDTSMEVWVRWHRDQRLLEVRGHGSQKAKYWMGYCSPRLLRHQEWGGGV